MIPQTTSPRTWSLRGVPALVPEIFLTLSAAITLAYVMVKESLPRTASAALVVIPFALCFPSLCIWYVTFDGWTLNRFSISITPFLTASTVVTVLWVLSRIPGPRFSPFLRRGLTAPCTLTLLLFFADQVLSQWLALDSFNFEALNNLFYYLLLLSFISCAHDLRNLTFVSIASGVVLALFGIAQLILQGFPADGLTGYYANHVQYGFYLLLSLILVAQARAAASGSPRMFLNSVGFLLFLLTLCTLARGVILVGATIFVCWYAIQRNHWKATVVGLILAAAVVVGPPMIIDRMRDVVHVPSFITNDVRLNAFLSGRIPLVRAAWEMFLSSPAFGVGSGTFRTQWSSHAPIIWVGTETRGQDMPAHSTFMQLLAEVGLVGFLLYSATLLAALMDLRFAWKHFGSRPRDDLSWVASAAFLGILAFILHGTLDNSGWVDRPLYLLLAMSVSLRSIAEGESDQRPS